MNKQNFKKAIGIVVTTERKCSPSRLQSALQMLLTLSKVNAQCSYAYLIGLEG